MLMPAAGEFKKIHDFDTNFVSLEDFFQHFNWILFMKFALLLEGKWKQKWAKGGRPPKGGQVGSYGVEA